MMIDESIKWPLLTEWPLDGLEDVLECPACSARASEPLYLGLTDRAFHCAPGKWSLRRCCGCGSAFLSPRPTAETLLLAYSRYYTHDDGKGRPAMGWEGIRLALANGYRNWRHGTQLRPAWPLGALLAYAMPLNREAINFEGRHLPRAWTGARLLDVGFGSGAFLEFARAKGWQVAGVDFDPQTVESARARGLDVRKGGIEAFSDEAGTFDVVTISHVIEHVPDPRRLLESAFLLLKNDGVLWLETPNIDAFGHEHFGPHWRGLEVPRHLVVFSRKGLFDLMHKVGFDVLEEHPRMWNYPGLAAASRAMAAGRDPAVVRLHAWDRLLGLVMRSRLAFNPMRTEFLTVVARKPRTL